MNAIPLRHDDDVIYPESDGQPMGETELHVDEIFYLIQAFRKRFEAAADVYVIGNLFFYYQRGNPSAVLCPDLMVVRGVAKERRRIFKLWEEGAAPCLVVEVTSASTWREDLGRKKACYERLGVAEYFLYDPLGEALSSPLQGFRLEDGSYRPIAREADGSLVSRTTGVTLRLEGERLRLVESATGRPLQRIDELDADLEVAREVARRERAARQAAEDAAAREAAARRALEEEVARLRGELERPTSSPTSTPARQRRRSSPTR